MDQGLMSPYDRMNVAIDGLVIWARPVQWNGEIVDAAGHLTDGALAAPLLYEGTCPHCAQLIMITAGLKSARCGQCGRGTDVKLIEDFPDLFQDPGEYSVDNSEAPPNIADTDITPTTMEAINDLLDEDAI